MSRVTVTNNVAGTYLVPSPISKKIGSGQTEVFDGILAADLEKGHVLQQAIADGTITVVVSDDPNVPNEVEVSVLSALAGKGANFRTDEFTAPAAEDDNAIKLTFATTATDRTFAGVGVGGLFLDGVVGTLEMIPPRNVTITSSNNNNCTAVNAVITGHVRNESGALVLVTETLATILGGGGGDLVAKGLMPFSFVTSVYIPAQGGGAGANLIGFGPKLGLHALVKSRCALIAPLREIENAVVVTTGTFTNPATSPVSVYSIPANVPNAALNYSVFYEVG